MVQDSRCTFRTASAWALIIVVAVMHSTSSGALLFDLGPDSFSPLAPQITFNEFAYGASNPSKTFTGLNQLGDITVSFGGMFRGQAAGGGFPVTLTDTSPAGPLQIETSGPEVFVTNDGASNTNPVLSGTPTFNGPISIHFSKPVSAVGLKGGYFDNAKSTKIEAYDAEGQSLGSILNSKTGFEFYGLATASGANQISGVSFYITGNEPAGFAIDNVTFGAVNDLNASLVFREGAKDGSWLTFFDEIPGWDHVGLNFGGKVYESHPGYPEGNYWDAEKKTTVPVISYDGVQQVHTLGSFKHDSKSVVDSPVNDFESIPVPMPLADKMVDFIDAKIASGAGFNYLSFNNYKTALLPAQQKGEGNEFTCVGLIEAAAEAAGHNNGQGFIPNYLESHVVKVRHGLASFEAPMLSPSLLNWVVDPAGDPFADKYVAGILDPVDFLLTDPLGRRFGYAEGIGWFDEIDNARYTGDGDFEQFLILNPTPGRYRLQVFGKGTDAWVGIFGRDFGWGLDEVLRDSEIVTYEFTIPSDAVPEPITGATAVMSFLALTCAATRRSNRVRPTKSMFCMCYSMTPIRPV